jgi:tetratricopeptide (TPR) repeat protein
MARCERCGASGDLVAAFCSQCGMRVADQGGAGEAPRLGGGEATYPLLARANLLRMRGRWGEAAELCLEVLRLEPRNPSAHSLLGDVYENQGNLAEAIHWYDLALALSPGSEADAAKKARAQELLEARQRRAEWQAAIQRRSPVIGPGAVLRETVLRIVAIVGAAVCAIVLVTAVLVAASERVDPHSGNAPPGLPRPPRPRPTLPATSPRERQLMGELSRTGEASGPHGQITSLRIDPRTEVAILSALASRAALSHSSLAARREALLRDGYWLARSLHEKDHALQFIQVDLFGDMDFAGNPGGHDRLFTGTLSASDLGIDPVRATADELERFYEGHCWWNSALSG